MKVPPEVLQLLKVAAPTLATAFGTPLAGIAAAAATAALERWLYPDGPPGDGRKATPGEIADCIRANADDPRLLEDLRAAEARLLELQEKNNFRFAELEVRDREGARRFARDTGAGGFTQRLGVTLLALDAVVTVGVIAGAFVLLTGVVVVTDPTVFGTLMTFIGIIIGRVSARADTYINFVFGSSAGGEKNTEAFGDAFSDLGRALADRPQQPAMLAAPAAPPVVVVPQAQPGVTLASHAAGKPSRFLALVDRLLIHEGGYVDHPSDPGGCTSMGITIGTLGDWRREAVTCDDVRALTRGEAKEIYYARYWNALRCDDLPPGVDYIAFDFGVNAGVGRSARTLQAVLQKRDPSLKIDGVVGRLTLAAMAKASPQDVVEEFHEERMRYYQSLDDWGTFGKGWARRSAAVLAEARAAAVAQRIAA